MTVKMVAEYIISGKKVKYNGKYYRCTAIIKRIINGQWAYSAELLDECGRSVTIARCEEVTEIVETVPE